MFIRGLFGLFNNQLSNVGCIDCIDLAVIMCLIAVTPLAVDTTFRLVASLGQFAQILALYTYATPCDQTTSSIMMRPWCALLLVTCTVLSAVSDTGGAPDHLAIQRVAKTIECWRRPRGNNNEWPRSVPALYESTDNVWPDGEIIYQFFNYSLIRK